MGRLSGPDDDGLVDDRVSVRVERRVLVRLELLLDPMDEKSSLQCARYRMDLRNMPLKGLEDGSSQFVS